MSDFLGYAFGALLVSLLVGALVQSARSRRDRARLPARVHGTAAARCCPACGSPYRPWDGQLGPLTFLRHVNYAGGGLILVHQIRLDCDRCGRGHEFLVRSDGELVDIDLFRPPSSGEPGQGAAPVGGLGCR